MFTRECWYDNLTKGKHYVYYFGVMMDTNITTKNDDLAQMRLIINSVLSAQPDNSYRSSARAEILTHAISVFSTRGLERTTVQHLLDAASVSRRTFYKYFKNKHDVLESIYEIFVEHMVQFFKVQAEGASTVRDIISNTFSMYFDYHLSLGAMIRLMAEEARRMESVLWPHREKAFQSTAQVLQTEMYRVSGRKHDLLVFHTIIWTLEGCSLQLLNQTDCSPQTLANYKDIVTGIAEAILVDGTAPALFVAQ